MIVTARAVREAAPSRGLPVTGWLAGGLRHHDIPSWAAISELFRFVSAPGQNHMRGHCRQGGLAIISNMGLRFSKPKAPRAAYRWIVRH
jgi:hypothetical protein